jgi:tellurite resistance protein TerC
VTVPFWVWAATVVALLAVLAVDLLIVGRRPHEVSMGEAARWVGAYIAMAALFAVGLAVVSGQQAATEFVAGYITEYSLSVDNLFVFLLIMSAFAVPKVHQHRVLLFGILIALVLRGGFILAGAAVISRFSWVFYLFGAFLVLTAIKVVASGAEDDEYRENAALRLVRRVLPVTDDFVGTRSIVRRPRPGSPGGRGQLMVTPMLLVMLTIGVTDLLFALDSIPAVFGLTRDPYLVFTANVFALMGLRQLYFLLGGLLRSLVYLSYGLGVILAFIGVKLVLEALHTNTLPFLNDGRPVAVPVIGIELSLAVIVGVLLITTVASLVKVRFFPPVDAAPAPGTLGRTDQRTGPKNASSATDAAPPAVPRT